MSRHRVERNIAFDEHRQRYYVTLNFGKNEIGNQVKQTKTFPTLTAARKALRAHEADRDKGAVLIPTKLTVSQWLDSWMTDVIEPNRATTTAYGYRQIIENHLKPALGQIELQKLSPQRLQRYYTSAITEKSLSTNTVRKHHDLLKTALQFAVLQGVLLFNPTDRVRPPSVTEPERHFYTIADVQKLLSLEMEPWLHTAVHLAAYLGLRREEICGLRWSCIDFEKHLIYIKTARTTAGSQIVEKAPKCKSSSRTLFCPPPLEQILLAEKKRQEQLQEEWHDMFSTEDFIIVWNDGSPIRPNYISERFTKLVRDNGLPSLTLHGLRHTFATLANAQGASLFDIGKTLGHSTPSTTGKVYTHMLDTSHHSTIIGVSQAVTENALSQHQEQKPAIQNKKG